MNVVITVNICIRGGNLQHGRDCGLKQHIQHIVTTRKLCSTHWRHHSSHVILKSELCKDVYMKNLVYSVAHKNAADKQNQKAFLNMSHGCNRPGDVRHNTHLPCAQSLPA